MNLYAIISLVSAIVLIFLSNNVYYKDTRNLVNRVFALGCLAIAYYAFIEFLHSQALVYDMAILAYKLGSFRYLATGLVLHFVLVFTGRWAGIRTWILVIVIYIPAVTVSVIDLTTNLITVELVHRSWGWSPVYADNIVRYIGTVWALSLYFLSVILSFYHYLKTQAQRDRKQAKYIAIGISLPLIISAFSALLRFPEFLTVLPNLTSAAALIGIAFIAFAIWRYGLFSLSPASAAETILATMSDALLLLGPDGRMERANESALNMLGYKQRELIGRPLSVITADDKSVFLWNKQGGFTDVEAIFKTKNRDGVPVSLSTSVIRGSDGEVQGIICIGRDQTERIMSEMLLREKNRELEIANKTKSKFLANMSHELRTPLNAIIGFSELLLDGVVGNIDEEQKECVKDISNNGQQLLSLVNDVLDISKVEAGKMEMRIEPLELTDIINTVTQTVRILIDNRKHVLNVNVEEGLPKVFADRTRLRQVFLNLLSNSIKFTPEGGEISIEASKDGELCRICVIDNGIGIKKEEQERMFEAFVQVDSLPDKTRSGAGLGLALTKHLVEALSGRICVESEYGKGSRFTFYMPLTKTDELE